MAFILTAAVAFQLIAAVLAIRLIRLTGTRWAWSAIAAGILLMVARRSVPLLQSLTTGQAIPLDPTFEVLGLAISIFMVAGIAGIGPVFAARSRAEQRIVHLNAVLKAIRNVNQLITREKNRDRLLAGTCESLTETRGYRHAWIALVDATSRPMAVAQAGLGEGFTLLRERLLRGEPTPCMQTVLRARSAVILGAGAAECSDCPLCDGNRDGRVMAARLAYGHEVYGVLVAALPERYALDEEEQDLFDEAAADVAFALHSLRVEEDRRRAEQELRLDESRLEALLRLNQMADASLHQITDFALEEAVRLTQSRIGYLAFTNADESVLTMHSWSKSAMAQCAIIDKPLVYPVVTTGLWGEAVRQRKPVITNDYETPNPLKKGYPGGHVPVTRHMNLPVFDGEHIAVVAGVGNKEEPYGEADVRQLTLLMQGMWQLIQRQRTQERLREANDALENRVQQRTAELAGANQELRRTAEELRTASQAAEAASRAKSTFLANMSHEIRTPLNAIIGMTELVLKGPVSAQQREFLTTVRDSGEALLSVINDVLDFSKIEAGKLALERQTFDLRESLGDTMKSFALRAHQQGLELVCYIHPEVPRLVAGDYGRLRQIVVNLVGNALKFTEHGEVTLEVWRESAQADQVALHCTVADTGIGIPADKLATIFGMFEQGDASMSRRHGGTGLGLAIAARLVELMGGQLWVESEVGQGSRFHFTIILGLAQPASSAPPLAEPVQIHGLRVLVVDDNATNRRILEEVLRSWHMSPVAVAGAAEARQMLCRAHEAGDPFRLVLTDAHMPGEDGFTLAGQIKHDANLGSTVVMMLTSGDRREDAARCEELGIAAYLLKPIKQSELLVAIETALGIRNRGTKTNQPAERHAHRADLRILLAEDSLINQKLAVALLEGEGHKVTVAANGREAVAATVSQPFDLLLMDVQMPELDGLEATAQIRAQERQTGTHLPIIAMTAHALKGDRERCLSAGMDGYIAKPIRAQELYDAIDSVIAAQGHPLPPEKSAVDWGEALASVQGDARLLRTLVEAAHEETPRLMSAIGQAVAAGDVIGLRLNAHTLKGSLRYFGAERAVERAFQLEQMGREGRRDCLGPIFASLEAEIAAVTAAFAAFLSQAATSP